jgi:hypothetical protein
MGGRAVLFLVLLLSGCGSASQDPVVFLPRVVGPEGADLDALRSRYCRGIRVSLGDDFLTHENFRSIFNCANYDSSLEGLRPLFGSREFPELLRNLNLILSSSSTENLRETLRPWLEEGPQGTSRLDRLLPVLGRIIKNPSFQDGLPLIDYLLQAGQGEWRELLPGMADLVYQERFPDNLEDIARLLEDLGPGGERDYAIEAKQWATLLQTRIENRSVALRALELADRIREIELSETSIQEYLDHMNEKGVFVSLYLDSGAVRGEVINPKLNSEPDEEELRDGLELSPDERQERAYRKLFARGEDGSDAPIVQLASLVEEFHRDRPDFLPNIARWFSANGPTVVSGLTEYVVRAHVLSNLSRLSMDSYLMSYAAETGVGGQQRMTGPEFVQFLRQAFSSPSFSSWLNTELLTLNREQFGPRNGELLRGSMLRPLIVDLYNLPAVPEFGATLIPARPLALSAAVTRFSNLHRTERLEVDFRGGRDSLERHLVDLWWAAASATLGEEVVVEFVVKLAQTFFSEMAADFSKKGMTLSEWYFSSPYGDPGSTEAVAGYLFYELRMMPRYHRHKAYLKGEFAEKLFPGSSGADDRRAFSLLVDQVPNIWLYLKSGMSRSGNDLTRALTSKDRGYLIRRYVDLLASGYRTGWIRDAVLLVEAYHAHFPAAGLEHEVSDELDERRRVSKGADALKRVMRSLFEPQRRGDYATSTLGRILAPLSSLVSPQRRPETERFILTSADEVLKMSDEQINDFLRDLFESELGGGDSVLKRRETLKATAELLRDPIFPDVIQQLSQLFQEEAIRPALDFLSRKIDDGSLQSLLLFLRRILGFRG